MKPKIFGLGVALALVPALALADEDKAWGGSVEAGLAYGTGNSEKQDTNAALKLDYRLGQWLHEFSGKAINSKSDGTRSAEEYRAGWKTSYDLTDVDYVFANADYVNNRFAGYTYRITEAVGYGRKLLDDDTFKLSTEIGIGYRQNKLLNGTHEDGFLVRPGLDFEWKISDTATFSESLDIAIGADATITNSETAMKVQVLKNIYMKAGFSLEHISDVPAGRENTDTLSTLNLVYDF